MIEIATGFTLLLPLSIVFLGKHPMVWKEYCEEYLSRELKENIDKYTDRRDLTKATLKTAFYSIK